MYVYHAFTLSLPRSFRKPRSFKLEPIVEAYVCTLSISHSQAVNLLLTPWGIMSLSTCWADQSMQAYITNRTRRQNSFRQNLKNSQPSNRNVCGLYYYITFRYRSSKCLNKHQHHINIVVSIFLSLVLLVADRRGPLTHWLPEARRDPKNSCGYWGVILVAWFDLCHLSCRLLLLYRL